jgi:hypothetical protein
MDEKKLFEKNVELWSRMHPKEALFLPYVEADEWAFCTTKKGELNLATLKDGKKFYCHPNAGAKMEAEAWFSGLDLDKVHILYVYGVGLGYYYEATEAWLREDPSRFLVFLEDDIKVIRRLLETTQGSRILHDPQVYLLYFQELRDGEALFESMYWNFAMTPMVVSALKSYKKIRPERLAELQHKIAYDNSMKNALVEEYLRYGGAFFINYYQNMLVLADSYLGNDMFRKFPKIPAIICGAGPSLKKNLHILKELQDKALIFAGGSALNVLNAGNISPHFGAGIDPNAAQLDRLKTNQAFETPFFYRNRMFHDAFQMIHGPRLYITGSGGYDIANWYEEKLQIEREMVDEGHNVVNFCVEIANAMGCDPIIFVGMDLAFTGLKAYAPGVEDKIRVKKEEILGVEDFDSRALVQKDIRGKPIYTLWKWVAESEWIGDYAKEHPEVRLINATEGGLGFPGVPNVTLAEAADMHLQASYDLRNRIHMEIQNCAMPQVTQEKVRSLTVELRDSLQRCVKLFEALLEEAVAMAEKIRKEKKLPVVLQSGRAALCETELADEPGYQCILEVFNLVQSRLLNRELQELQAPGAKLSDKQRFLKRIALNNRRLAFLRDTAKVNVALINLALEKEEEAHAKK